MPLELHHMTKRWFILPGMGATSAMYNGLRHKLPFKVDFINWPVYRGETSYADVAQRVIDENEITVRDTVGGSSLGGMVALEIVNILNSKEVVLIGSALHSGEIQTLLSLLSPLAEYTPLSVVQTFAGKHKNLVSRMFADSDPEFIRAMCLYFRSWRGYAKPSANVYRIHGRKDHVIPCPPTSCEVIDDAGHLLAITHPREVAAFLDKVRVAIDK
jgi:pimeloyl-ACP methyl ester carboxylesterase